MIPRMWQLRLHHLYYKLFRKIFWLKIGAYIADLKYTSIGENVHLSAGVKIYCQNHSLRDFNIMGNIEPVVIADDCWIGANAVILPGVILGKHTVVGAGAVVTKSFIEGNVVIAGVPAKIIKRL